MYNHPMYKISLILGKLFKSLIIQELRFLIICKTYSVNTYKRLVWFVDCTKRRCVNVYKFTVI
jgi:hypothetical protein